MQIQHNIAVADFNSYINAVAVAERRALHSYFDQHVIEDNEYGHVAIDEGDYNALPMSIIDRVVFTIPGAMHDEW